MKKTSKLMISLAISLSLFACNSIMSNNLGTNTQAINNAESDNKNFGNVTLTINDFNTKIKGFNTKGINFSNPLISQFKLEVNGLGITTPISETKAYTSGSPISFNLSVPAGTNRILELSALDSNGNNLSTLMGALNVNAGVNNTAQISQFETVVAQIIKNILNSSSSSLLNSFALNTLRTFIALKTGYDFTNNNFSLINPLLLDLLAISNQIIANNGTLPNEIGNMQAKGKVNVNLNVTGAKLSINDLNSVPVNSTSTASTLINDVNTGNWVLTVSKTGYVSQNINIKVSSSNAPLDVNVNLIPVVIPTPSPTPTPVPTATATSTPIPTPTPSPTAVPCTGTFCANNPLGKIAFVSNRDGAGSLELYVMNTDTSSQTRLTRNSFIDNSPSWSPDGTKIVFSSARNGLNDVYIINADGTGETKLTTNGGIYPNWSPDGSKIAFVSFINGFNQIFTMSPDGSNKTQITNYNENFDHRDLSWSPDGSKLAFVSGRSGHYDIYKMNSDGSNEVNLSNTVNFDSSFSPAWSPDGTKIAYSYKSNGNSDIYVMNSSDGSNKTNITNFSNNDNEPEWSLDGTKILFSSNRSSASYNNLYIMDANGSNVTSLTNTGYSDSETAWSKK